MLSQIHTPAGSHACKFKHVHTALVAFSHLPKLLPYLGYHASFFFFFEARVRENTLLSIINPKSLWG